MVSEARANGEPINASLARYIAAFVEGKWPNGLSRVHLCQYEYAVLAKWPAEGRGEFNFV